MSARHERVLDMKRIALITNFNIYDKANSALAVANILAEHDCCLVVASSNRDKIARLHKSHPEFSYVPFEQLYENIDLAVVL